MLVDLAKHDGICSMFAICGGPGGGRQANCFTTVVSAIMFVIVADVYCFGAKMGAKRGEYL